MCNGTSSAWFCDSSLGLSSSPGPGRGKTSNRIDTALGTEKQLWKEDEEVGVRKAWTTVPSKGWVIKSSQRGRDGQGHERSDTLQSQVSNLYSTYVGIRLCISQGFLEKQNQFLIISLNRRD